MGSRLMTNDEPTTDDGIEFETENGASVVVTADAGNLCVTVESDSLSFDDENAQLDTASGTDVLDCGRQRTDDGDRTKAYIPVGEHKGEIEVLVEESKDYDAPLVFEVDEKRARHGGASATDLYLAPTKGHAEMTDEQDDQYRALDKIEDVPAEAEVGDEYAADELLGDEVSDGKDDEDDEDDETADDEYTATDAALDEAAETGERVPIDSAMVACDGSEGEECSTDRVTRYATPGGEIEAERAHLY